MKALKKKNPPVGLGNQDEFSRQTRPNGISWKGAVLQDGSSRLILIPPSRSAHLCIIGKSRRNQKSVGNTGLKGGNEY